MRSKTRNFSSVHAVPTILKHPYMKHSNLLRSGAEWSWVDEAAGFSGARLWPYTIRYVDKVDGTVKIMSTDLLVDPINPVAGDYEGNM